MREQDDNRKETTPELPLWSYQMQLDSKLAVRTRKDLELQLIARCFEDKEFYQELLTNPKKAIEKEFKTQLPQNIEIQVVQETETTLFMVLPCNPYQLSEEELKNFLGMTYEDVALWVYQDMRSTLLDESSSVTLLSRFWKDEELKHELLDNPKAVIENELGHKISEDIDIKMLSESADTLYIVLPNLTDELHILEDFPVSPELVEVALTPTATVIVSGIVTGISVGTTYVISRLACNSFPNPTQGAGSTCVPCQNASLAMGSGGGGGGVMG